MQKNRTKNKSKNAIKPVIINERDKSLLSAVADYRILNTEQVFRMFFPSIGRARKRLRQLWHHRYLKRIVKPTRMGEGSSMFLYTSTRRGLRIISADLAGRKKCMRLSSFHIDHILAINTFRICLESATPRSKEVSLESWNEGKELLMKASIKDRGIVRQIPIIPDAYFALKHDERIFHYFLEIDRGTTDLKRIILKCRGYLDIWQGKIAQSKFSIRSFRVLYVTTGEKRLTNMLEQLRKIISHHNRLDLILATSTNAYSMSQPKRLFEPIWKILDTAGNIREIGLLPFTSFQRNPWARRMRRVLVYRARELSWQA